MSAHSHYRYISWCFGLDEFGSRVCGAEGRSIMLLGQCDLSRTLLDSKSLRALYGWRARRLAAIVSPGWLQCVVLKQAFISSPLLFIHLGRRKTILTGLVWEWLPRTLWSTQGRWHQLLQLTDASLWLRGAQYFWRCWAREKKIRNRFIDFHSMYTFLHYVSKRSLAWNFRPLVHLAQCFLARVCHTPCGICNCSGSSLFSMVWN